MMYMAVTLKMVNLMAKEFIYILMVLLKKEIINGKLDGFARVISPDGVIFEGIWKDDKVDDKYYIAKPHSNDYEKFSEILKKLRKNLKFIIINFLLSSKGHKTNTKNR